MNTKYKCVKCGKNVITFDEVLKNHRDNKTFDFVCNSCKKDQ